jgi:hypothetical protein
MRKALRNGTVIEMLLTGTRVILPDGSLVFGEPHDSEQYRETARRCGYGDDTLALCRDHDPCHAILCDWLGLPDSPALRAAIGLDADPVVAAAEEDAVLSLQRFCRAAGVKLFIEE